MGLIIVYWLLILIMLVGVVGAVVPGLPGSSLILFCIIVWGIITGFKQVGVALITICIVLALSTGVQFLATYWGAKKVGASNWSQTGAIIGLILGFMGLLPALPIGGPILGLLLGLIVGAFAGEFLYRRDLTIGDRTWQASKVSLAVAVSSLIGNVIEGLLAITAVIVFVISNPPPGL